MNLKEQTEQIKCTETARFNYFGKVAIKPTNKKPCFSGCMDLITTANIELGYNPDYIGQSKDLESLVSNPFQSAFTSLLRHELNHKGGNRFHGCPKTLDLHVKSMLEPASEKLRDLGFPNLPATENQTLYEYFANLIEDILDNSELGNNSDHFGMWLMYDDGAQILPKQQFGALFTAFVMLQQELYGGKRSRKLLSEHYSDNKKAKKAVQAVLDRLGLKNLQRENLSLKEKQKLDRRKTEKYSVLDRHESMKYLLAETNWPEISTVITEEFSKLIDKNKLQKADYRRLIFVPLKGEADHFKSEMGDKETLMKFVWEKYLLPGGQFSPPAYLENYQSLDFVYQRLARNLEIKTNASTRSEAIPIVWYGKKAFDPKNDRLSRVRVGLSRSGKLELQSRRFHEDDVSEYSESRGKIPEIKYVMMDTSGTMKIEIPTSRNSGKIMNPWADQNMQWTDRSRYHYGLTGWYSLLELARKEGALKHTSIRLTNYSSQTRNASNLSEAVKLALSPEFGATYLDLEGIKNLFGREQLVLSVSDGGIANWDDWLVEPETDSSGKIIKDGLKVCDEYIRKAKQNYYVHIQIGDFVKDSTGKIVSKPKMCRDLEDNGLCVVYDDGTNLGKIVADLTKPFLKRGN